MGTLEPAKADTVIPCKKRRGSAAVASSTVQYVQQVPLGVFLAELEAHYPSVLVPEDISLPDGRLIRTRKQFIRDSVDILVNGEVSGLSANLGADLRRSSLLFQVAVADRSQMDTRQQAAYVCERVLELCGGDMTQLDLVSIVATQALGVTLYERLISRYKNDGCVITQAGSTLIYASSDPAPFSQAWYFMHQVVTT
jgi:hypothetical protein